METVSKIMTELKKLGNESARETYARHGAPDNMFGVRIADLKTISKRIKGQQELAYGLYETGNIDAMYLAGIVADGSQMTKKLLETWAKSANWHMLEEYSVPGVAAESEHGRSLALKWIRSKKAGIASCGWCTYSGLISVRDDSELDLDEIKQLLKTVEEQIDDAPNRVRYTMNGFVISVGTYVEPLLKQAKATAKKLGVVSVDMGDTSCKVPLASAYIKKVEDAGRVGRKRKSAKC